MAGFDTQIIHAGEPQPGIEGAVTVPVFRSAMFAYDGNTEDYNALRYLRLNNSPNHLAVQAKLAALEETEAALVCSSGMAAISTAVLALLRTGDHLLAQDCLYGGTHDLFTKDLPEWGITCDFLDPDPKNWAAQIKPTTRMIYTEALTNPTLRIIDHRAVTAFARAHDLIAMIDSTFATPLNFKPATVGYDLVAHSATKYLNGHSDLVAGALAGRKDLVTRVLHKLNHLGGCLDPDTCFMLHRGMKTLGVRVRRQNDTAAFLAARLAENPLVARVDYPGVAGHPDSRLGAELFRGYGGVFSFALRADLSAEAWIGHTTLPLHTFSLGGVETLVVQPAKTSHLSMGEAARARLGILPGLVRVSVGLEDPEDLLADFERALTLTAAG